MKHLWNRKEKGVSEVLGFLLLIAIIMVVFTYFMATVVPNYVSYVEAQHYQDVVGQVFQVKATLMNTLSVGIFPNQIENTLSVGVATFPLFVPPSEGKLTLVPYSPNLNYFNVSFETSSGVITISTGASFSVSLYNHAFSSEEVIFDNGLIATGKLDAPVSSLSVISNGTVGISGSSLMLVLFTDVGPSTSSMSSGSIMVNTLVTSISSNTYQVNSGSVTITISSPLAYLWANYLKSLGSVTVSVSGSVYTITVSNIQYVTVKLMTFTMNFSTGGG